MGVSIPSGVTVADGVDSTPNTVSASAITAVVASITTLSSNVVTASALNSVSASITSGTFNIITVSAANIVSASINSATFQAGSGTERYSATGLIDVSTTEVATTAGGTNTLMTYIVPANTLNAANKGLEVVAWGRTTNSSSAKSLTVLVGTSTATTHTFATSLNNEWFLTMRIFRTNVSVQRYISRLERNSAAGADIPEQDNGSFFQDLAAGVTIAIQASCSAAAEVVQEGMTVEFLG